MSSRYRGNVLPKSSRERTERTNGRSTKPLGRAPLKELDSNTQNVRPKRITRSSVKNGKAAASGQRRYSPYETHRNQNHSKDDDIAAQAFQRDLLTLEHFEPKPAHPFNRYDKPSSTVHPTEYTRIMPQYAKAPTLPVMEEESQAGYGLKNYVKREPAIQPPFQADQRTRHHQLATMSAPPILHVTQVLLQPATIVQNPFQRHSELLENANRGMPVYPPVVPMQDRTLSARDNSMTTHACDLELVSPMSESRDRIDSHGNLKKHVFDVNDPGPGDGVQILVTDQMVQSPPSHLTYRQPLVSLSPSQQFFTKPHILKLVRQAAGRNGTQYDICHYQYYRDEPSYDDDWLMANDIDARSLPTSHRTNITRYAFHQKQMKQAGSLIYRSHFGTFTVDYKTGVHNAVDVDVPLHEEYRGDYYRCMVGLERRYAPKHDYIERMEKIDQTGSLKTVSKHTRFVVIDWMLEVLDEKKNLSPESFHTAVSYMDRYLSGKSGHRQVIRKDKMQEVGTTAFALASKFIDYLPPRMREFADMTDHQARRPQILERERDFLKELTCELSSPTPYHFLIEYMSAMNLNSKEHRPCRRAALYLCDMARLDYDLLAFPNSIIALACLFCGITAYRNGNCFQNAGSYAFQNLDIDFTQIGDCVKQLRQFFQYGQWSYPEDSYNTITRWCITAYSLHEKSLLLVPGYLERELKELEKHWDEVAL